MFVWDEGTNRLSLASGRTEPWIRPGHAKIAEDDPNSWLYCTECRERWFRKAGERGTSHVPFRDKASQHFLKPTYRRGKEKEEADASEQQEPESEPPQLLPYGDEGEDEAVDAVVDEEEDEEEDEEDEWVPDLPPDGPPRPSVEEYQKRWDSLKAWHARCVPGDFCRDNLVPVPEPQLWQAI